MDKVARLVLTERDLGILLMVHSYWGCALEHVRRRFFPKKGARSACYERVSRLVKAGYITTTRLPSLSGQGSGKSFLVIGPRSRPVVARSLGLSRRELGRMRMDSPLFIGHHLSLCDVRLSFELGAERSGVFSLQDWTADRELKREPMRVKDPKAEKEICLVPDARFTLVLPDGAEQIFFLEMDMGTVAPKRLRARLRGYLVRALEQSIPVLFVALSKDRQTAIARFALEEARGLDADPTIFWLTSKDDLDEKSVFSAPIWQVVGGPAGLALGDVSPGKGEPVFVFGSSRPGRKGGRRS